MRDPKPTPAAAEPSWTVAQILDFARTRPNLGLKDDRGIRSQLHMSRTRYLQVLNTLVDPDQAYLAVALSTDAITTNRIIDRLATRTGARARHTP